MLYKVIVTGSRGDENVYYMDDNTFKSMCKDSILKYEIVDKKEANKDDTRWSFDSKIY
tara:strand:+ start:1124 stop:1297 length:174 start_codon:yes stop_codon:yes gene_type:complete